jgi:Cu2+-containing amine oxidase
MYFLDGAGVNLYAKPIEGVQAIADLDTRQVIEVLDSGVVPVPMVTHNFDEASIADRLIDWIFTQSGAIRAEVSLTGIDIPKGVLSTSLTDPTAPQDMAHGALVAPNLVATYHSDHFNFRLDMDLDGRANSFMAGKLVPQDTGGASARQSVWVPQESLVRRESDGRLSDDLDLWRIVNPGLPQYISDD